MIVGFSTGALALGDFARGLELLEPTRADAVELSALRDVELPKLLEAIPLLMQRLNTRYRYVSFHAPTNFTDERSTVAKLATVADRGLNVIVHPDTMRELSLWQRLGKRLCIENLDSRRPTGRTAQELRKFFVELPEARLCLDIAHARQVDSTMTVAADILTEFGDRLAQAHLSELNSRGKHFAMSYAAKRAYELFAAPLARVPVILESVVTEGAIAEEISEVEKILSHQPRFTPAGFS
ncbi:hypothetical protein [Bradyrhizobium sp. Arg816]|uniref:hypothetical protein n=1 Tax=Bradyrhizobium sp. Arg816 TaxID=2998491 RepID=UPI00249F62FE|nr:hypothetical protein [Bradyrhizobium sp. Arg816]MDI3560176.1 hypothetical protein [Bradyrhizobium sp. Arg816]